MRKALVMILVACSLFACKKESPADNNSTGGGGSSAPDSIRLATSTFTFTAKSTQMQNGKWVIQGTYGSGYYVWIYTGLTAAPTSAINLSLVAPTVPQTIPALNSSQAYIYLAHSATYESYWGGTVQLTISGNKVVASLNNINVSVTSSGMQIPLSMKWTQP